MSYRVLITSTARAQILEQARYIAVDCEAPLNAQRWLERVFEAAENCPPFQDVVPWRRRTISAILKYADCWSAIIFCYSQLWKRIEPSG